MHYLTTEKRMTENKAKESLQKISEDLKADIIVYSGEIDFVGTEKFMEVTQSPKNPNVSVMSKLKLLCI